MPDLFSKDEDLLKSAPYMGYKVLELIEASGRSRVSIFDVANGMKKDCKSSTRSLYYGVLFLFALELIDFEQPYLVRKS